MSIATLPPPLEASSQPPPLFDGTTRLYISYMCPYAQRVWIARNYKGLQEKIKLVPIDLQNRPAWYKEKVYPANKVPALEHDGKVIGESMDLLKYLDDHFDGPTLHLDDPIKTKFGEELVNYLDKLMPTTYGIFRGEKPVNEADAGLDYLEDALAKFEDGPFFLGQFSAVDVAYAPFIERVQMVLLDVFKYDITAGRPKLAAYIEELNKIEAYKQTKYDSEKLLDYMKKRFARTTP